MLQSINLIDINFQPNSQLDDKDFRSNNVSYITSNVKKGEIKARRLWRLSYDKDLANQKSEDKKMK